MTAKAYRILPVASLFFCCFHVLVCITCVAINNEIELTGTSCSFCASGISTFVYFFVVIC